MARSWEFGKILGGGVEVLVTKGMWTSLIFCDVLGNSGTAKIYCS